MAIFGNINTLDIEISDNVQYLLVKEYVRKLQRNFTNENSFYLGIGKHKKVQLSNDVFAVEQVYETKESTFCCFEAHKKYIDAHYIIDGSESIAVSRTKGLEVIQRYDEEGDYSLYREPANSSTLLLSSGDIAIFFPDDAHMTSIMTVSKMKVIKTVVKIPLEVWNT